VLPPARRSPEDWRSRGRPPRLRFGTGGEQDYARIIRLNPGSAHRAAGHQAVGEAKRLVDTRDSGARILYEQDASSNAQNIYDLLQICELDETAGGKQDSDRGKFAGRAQVFQTPREVEHGRHPSVGIQGEKDDRDPLHVRQEDSHGLTRRRNGRELSPKNKRSKH
jgi:hypothetical protein